MQNHLNQHNNVALKFPIWLGLLIAPIITFAIAALLLLIGYSVSEGLAAGAAFAFSVLYIFVICLIVSFICVFLLWLPYFYFLQYNNRLNAKNSSLGASAITTAATVLALTNNHQSMQKILFGGLVGLMIGLVLSGVFCYINGVFNK